MRGIFDWLKERVFFILLIICHYYVRFIDDSNKIIIVILSSVLFYLIYIIVKKYKEKVSKNEIYFRIGIMTIFIIFYSFMIHKYILQYKRTKIIVEEVKKSEGLYYNRKKVKESDILKNDIYKTLNVFDSSEKSYKTYEAPESYLETSNGYKIEFTFIYRSLDLCMVHIYTDNKKPLIISSRKGKTSFCRILLDQSIKY